MSDLNTPPSETETVTPDGITVLPPDSPRDAIVYKCVEDGNTYRVALTDYIASGR